MGTRASSLHARTPESARHVRVGMCVCICAIAVSEQSVDVDDYIVTRGSQAVH